MQRTSLRSRANLRKPRGFGFVKPGSGYLPAMNELKHEEDIRQNSMIAAQGTCDSVATSCCAASCKKEPLGMLRVPCALTSAFIIGLMLIGTPVMSAERLSKPLFNPLTL